MVAERIGDVRGDVVSAFLLGGAGDTSCVFIAVAVVNLLGRISPD